MSANLDTLKILLSSMSEAEMNKSMISYASTGNLEAVKYIFESGSKIYYPNVIMWAAHYGQLEIIQYFIPTLFDVHYHDDIALRWAVDGNQINVVHYLIEQGADITVGDITVDNNCCIYQAVSRKEWDMAKYLLEQYKDAYPCPEEYLWFLKMAIQCEAKKLIKYIICPSNYDKMCFDEDDEVVNICNDKLMKFAIQKGYVQMFKILAEPHAYGADDTIKSLFNPNNITEYLDYAQSNNQPEISEYIKTLV